MKSGAQFLKTLVITILMVSSFSSFGNEPTPLPEINPNDVELTPIITSPVSKDKIASTMNELLRDSGEVEDFFSFISDQPSKEELGRVLESEMIAERKGYRVTRIIIPVDEVKRLLETQQLHTNLQNLEQMQQVKSYFGVTNNKINATPEDLQKLPTPVESRLAKFFPLRDLIIKPIAWSAHTDILGTASVTLVSTLMSYFTSLYYHAIRLFYNDPHGLRDGAKLSEFLRKINMGELAEKFGFRAQEGNLVSKMKAYNALELAKIIQYAAKNFTHGVFNATIYKVASMQGGFLTPEFHLHTITSKLYSMSYYPVSWVEDRVVLQRLIHRDTLAKITLFKCYVGGALSTWDLSGGMVPFLDVRPGVLLMGFNALSLTYFYIYQKYAMRKFGLNTPEKLQAFIEKKTKLEKFLNERLYHFKDLETWKRDLFYRKASRKETIGEMRHDFNESLRLINEIEIELNKVEQRASFLQKRSLRKQLHKVNTFEELDVLSEKISRKLPTSSSRAKGGLILSGNCLTLLRQLF